MGGKNKKQTVGYKFYAGANLVIARFVSKLLKIKIGDKTAWEGVSSGGDIAINAPRLFGTKVEGGVVGTFRFRKGESSQDVDAYLASLLGADISADIGVSSLTLVNPYLGNNPYIKGISVRAERVFELEDGVEQWYVEKAGIPSTLVPGGDATYEFNSLSAHSTPGYNASEATVILADGEAFSINAISGAYSLWAVDSEAIPPRKPWNCRIRVTKNGAVLGDFRTEEFDTPEEAFAFAVANPINISAGAGTYTVFLWDGDIEAYNNRGSHQFHIQATANSWDINPVHMIREALLNTEWGYGYDTADIDDANFREVADILYAETFGLSYFWDDDSSLDTVINKVLDHIDGVLYLDRDTLKFKIGLNRADYDPETLIELRTGVEVSRIENYKKPQFLDLVNTVKVNYYNIANGGSGSLSAANSALFLQQGVRKSFDAEYIMCCNASLAGRLLQRELDIKTNPYSSCDVYANSAAKTLRRGSVFKLTAPDYNYFETVMRVTEISYGDGKTKAIRISCTEDRFAMPTASAVETQDPDVSVVGNPVPLTGRLLIEEPYAFLVERLGQANVDSALAESPDGGYFGVAAKREVNALTCDVYSDDGAGYENIVRLDFCPYGELQAAISYLDSSFTLENLSELENLDGEILFQIDNEIMALGSIDISTGAVTGVLRGCFDTIPVEHAAGAKAFFIGAWLDGAEKEYVSGETVNVKLVPTNSAGTLPLDAAPVDALTFAGRARRPYAPGLFQIGGLSYPATASGAFDVTWAHRDRQAQADQIVDTLQPSVSLPQNQRYGLRFEKVSDNSLLVERTDIGAATATVTLNYTGNVRCKLWAIDDYGVSFQTHQFEFGYTPPGGSPTNTITATAYTPYVPTWEIDGNG